MSIKYTREKKYFDINEIVLTQIVFGESRSINKKYESMPIGYEVDGKFYYLRITTPDSLRCGGIQENDSGFTMPCNLLSEDPSEEELKWVAKWEAICSRINDLLAGISVAPPLRPYSLSDNKFKASEPVPTLWFKVGSSKQKDVNGIYAKFVDMKSYYENDDESEMIVYEPSDMVKKPFVGLCGFKMPSVTLSDTSFNTKLYLEDVLIDEFVAKRVAVNIPKKPSKLK